MLMLGNLSKFFGIVFSVFRDMSSYRVGSFHKEVAKIYVACFCDICVVRFEVS